MGVFWASIVRTTPTSSPGDCSGTDLGLIGLILFFFFKGGYLE